MAIKPPTLPTADTYKAAPASPAPTPSAPSVATDPANTGAARIPGPWEVKQVEQAAPVPPAPVPQPEPEFQLEIPTDGIPANDETNKAALDTMAEHLGPAETPVAIDFGAIIATHKARLEARFGNVNRTSQTVADEAQLQAPAWAQASPVPVGGPVPQHSDIAPPTMPPAPGPLSPFAAPQPQAPQAPQPAHLAKVAEAAAKAAEAQRGAALAMTALSQSMGNLQFILGEGFSELIKQAGRCDLGMGCDEAGTCYAVAHGRPEMCGAGEVQAEEIEQQQAAETPTTNQTAENPKNPTSVKELLEAGPTAVKGVQRLFNQAPALLPAGFGVVEGADKADAIDLYSHIAAPEQLDLAAVLPDYIYMWYCDDGIQIQGVTVHKNPPPASGRGRKPVPQYVVGAIDRLRLPTDLDLGAGLAWAMRVYLHQYYGQAMRMAVSGSAPGVVPAYTLYRGQGGGYLWCMAPGAMLTALPID